MCIEVNKKKAIIKFSLFILFFLIIFIFAYLYGAELIHLAEHPDEVRKYMLSIGLFGYILFLLIQIIHVIIAVIPGDMLYVLGGFVFGLPIGFLLSYAGVMLGTFAVFYLSRYLGYDFVTIFISKDKIDKISKILNSVKGMLGLFVICLIPMVPKDPLMYVAGLTPIKASKLFFVYALSRIPVTLMWVVIGANAYERNYLEIAITVVILIALVGLGFILQKKESKKLKIEKI